MKTLIKVGIAITGISLGIGIYVYFKAKDYVESL